MEEYEYPRLKPEDIDRFIFQVQNKQLDNLQYLKILEGFIYQFDNELQPPLDYIAQRDYELILVLQQQLADANVMIEWKVLIVNVLCNIFSLSPFACEYFCENGGLNRLNELCVFTLQSEYNKPNQNDFDKTNFRRLADLVLACIGTCIEYDPELSLTSLQSGGWIFHLFQIYQKPAQFRSLANYISLLIQNSPSDQNRLVILQISQIFVNLFNQYDVVIYAFILKTLRHIKDKQTLLILAEQNIILVLSNYLVSIQNQRHRDRSLILQFLFVMSTHKECHIYFSRARFVEYNLMKLSFITLSNNITMPQNPYSLKLSKKDDDSNSIVLLLGIVTNLIEQEFNQEFFESIKTITHMQIRSFLVIDCIINLLKRLLTHRQSQDFNLIFTYLQQTLLNMPQIKIYLQNNLKFKQSLIQIIASLSQLQPHNKEILTWYQEISDINSTLPIKEDKIEDDIDNLADILANIDLTENDTQSKM